jgi:hypothetical protein
MTPQPDVNSVPTVEAAHHAGEGIVAIKAEAITGFPVSAVARRVPTRDVALTGNEVLTRLRLRDAQASRSASW